jgi:hypothetical protein
MIPATIPNTALNRLRADNTPATTPAARTAAPAPADDLRGSGDSRVSRRDEAKLPSTEAAATSHILRGMLAYQNMMAKQRDELLRRGLLRTTFERVRDTLAAANALRAQFSVQQLLLAGFVIHHVRPYLAPAVRDMIRTVLVRAHRRLVDTTSKYAVAIVTAIAAKLLGGRVVLLQDAAIAHGPDAPASSTDSSSGGGSNDSNNSSSGGGHVATTTRTIQDHPTRL